jgi:uncharacterized membrane protein
VSVALANRWRGLAIVSMSALLALILVLRRSAGLTLENVVLTLLLAMPILAPLLGVARGNRHTYRWATLCVAPYLIVGMVEAIANPGARPWAATMLATGGLWFISLVAYLRVTARS